MTGKNVQFDDMEGGIFITGDVNHTKTERKYYEAPVEPNVWTQNNPDIWQTYMDNDLNDTLNEYEFSFSVELTPEEFYRLGRTLTREFYVEEVKYRKL